VASRYTAQVLIGKIETLIWFHYVRMKKSLMEGKRNNKVQGPTFVGTPKGTSHW